jgi:hypothetical protein
MGIAFEQTHKEKLLEKKRKEKEERRRNRVRDHDATVVTFGSVSIREYHVRLDDNPACRIGAPVGIDWEYQERLDQPLDAYEASRATPTNKRRQAHQLVLNYYQRRERLLAAGYSDDD